MSDGTPKNLREAILHGVCVGPVSQVIDNLENHFSDYAAQVCGRYALSKDPKEAETAMKIFEELTGRKAG